jgi:hypothetical protein
MWLRLAVSAQGMGNEGSHSRYSRFDFVYSIPYMFIRLPVNWVACAIVVGFLFVFSMYLLVVNDEVNFRWTVMVAVIAVAGGLVATLFGMLCYIAAIAATAKKAGLLVPFDLTLGEDGIRTQSVRGEGLLKWSAIAFVKRNRNYIFVGVTPYVFLLIPLRVLQSRQESGPGCMICGERLRREPEQGRCAAHAISDIGAPRGGASVRGFEAADGAAMTTQQVLDVRRLARPTRHTVDAE